MAAAGDRQKKGGENQYDDVVKPKKPNAIEPNRTNENNRTNAPGSDLPNNVGSNVHKPVRPNGIIATNKTNAVESKQHDNVNSNVPNGVRQNGINFEPNIPNTAWPYRPDGLGPNPNEGQAVKPPVQKASDRHPNRDIYDVLRR